jgi:4-amino-4-deoxy-L-arabinose transferase-like glycosyltransferase
MSIIKIKSIKIWLIILASTLILLYGVFLRIAPISTQPYWMDEGYTINAILSYNEGNIQGISAVLDSGQRYECFLYCYPTALLMNMTGSDPVTFRILAVLFGILSIGIIYLVARQIATTRIALLSAFLMTFGYFQIAWSTQARWYTMFTVFFWLAVLFFIKSLKAYQDRTQLIIYGLLTIISTILAILSQKIGIVLPLFFIAYILFISLKQKIIPLKTSIIISTLLLALAYTVDTLSGQNLFTNFISRITFNYNLPYYLSFFFREYWLFIPFAIYAVIENKKHAWFLLGIFLAYLIPLSFLTNIVHYRYMFHVTPVLYILTSIGLFEALTHIKWQHQYKNMLAVGIFVLLFFISGAGVIAPQSHYMLEADDPSTLSERPSYAYTPQPDWNSAYQFIQDNMSQDDIIISSHAHFNKIFLNQPGYWIRYDYLGIDGRTQWSQDDKEFYVGATIIDDLAELEQIVTTSHGYIVFDYMAIDGKIPEEMVSYIARYFEPVFHKKENEYSQVWVFKF